MKVTSVDEYITQFDGEIKSRLKIMREIIKKTAPEAEESVSYNIPAYKLGGKPLVYFSGNKNHIGFYAIPTTHRKFEKEFSKYKKGKGSVQFPLDQPLPKDLIEQVVLYRKSELQ